MELFSVDIFSGCGGLTEGMRQANFKTEMALEIDETASKVYHLNHPQTTVITNDIRLVSIAEIKRKLNGKPIHLLAGCPPCQGFSSMRRLNKKGSVRDMRNSLIMEYVRVVEKLLPYTIMMENVAGLADYHFFKSALKTFVSLGYYVDWKIVNVKDYGVPQSRERLVLVGSKLGEIKVAIPTNDKKTVRQVIGNLSSPEHSIDPVHKIFQVHTPDVQKRIELTPKNGGSRKDLPQEYTLKCHQGANIGFNDVYGRLRWDDYSTTITGGCLNPSKGRFLHPEQNRNISAREAAMLQSFPADYIFPSDIPKDKLALMIGNALPPTFSYIQSNNIKQHLIYHLG